MKIKIYFRDKSSSAYVMHIEKNEIVRFLRGRAKRIPPNKSLLVNSVPIKYIKSIRLSDKNLCTSCKKNKPISLCEDCLKTIWKSSVNKVRLKDNE